MDGHIVGEGETGLIVERPDGRVLEVPFATSFRWEVRGPRTCVGRWEGGRHVPCPTQEPTPHDGICLACSGLEHPECVFEPVCQRDGIACFCAFGKIPHVVYLAFFGTLAKVGMTQERRVEHRLREQGADAYIVLARYPDRGAARRAERAMSALHHVPQWRTWRETLPQMARPIAWDHVEEKAAQWVARLGAAPTAPIRRIQHKVNQPVGGRPDRVRVEGVHEGTWLGRKGPYGFYQAPGTMDVGLPRVAALKLTELPGRRIQATFDAEQA